MIKLRMTRDEVEVGKRIEVRHGDFGDGSFSGEARITSVRDDYVDFVYETGSFKGLRGSACVGRRTADGGWRWF